MILRQTDFTFLLFFKFSRQEFTQIGRIYLATKCFGLSMFMK